MAVQVYKWLSKGQVAFSEGHQLLLVNLNVSEGCVCHVTRMAANGHMLLSSRRDKERLGIDVSLAGSVNKRELYLLTTCQPSGTTQDKKGSVTIQRFLTERSLQRKEILGQNLNVTKFRLMF